MSSRSNTKALVEHTRQIMDEIGYPPLSKAQTHELRKAFNFRCAFCGGPFSVLREAPVDQAKPRVPGNLVPACHGCRNYRRVDEDWRAFMARRVLGNSKEHEYVVTQMETWLHANPLPPPMTSPVITAERQRVEEALATIAVAYRRLRAEYAALRRSQQQPSNPTADAEAAGVTRSVEEAPAQQPEGAPAAESATRSGRSELAFLLKRNHRAPPAPRPMPGAVP